ncbi:MAG: efflux RND transporter permease subunit, partial [Myxococcota bacterium]|nr:efflux RND transporter permease subunit [Myxococcota bacterium]
VFLIMGALFESFLLPIAIIGTIPMAAFGAYWSLYVTDSKLDNIAGIGLVILVGVVVNNGIVLVELVNRLRAEGKSRTEALIDAGTRRFRPILMTALTTIFGLVPMAFGSSSGEISYESMGRVVIGGMAAGTILTLFFIPLLYLILDDMRKGASRWMGWLQNKETA